MPKKILIVDDEHDVSTYLATILTENGYDPVVAESSRSGLELARKELPDLICLDIMMPAESGLTMYMKLKKSKLLKKTPVIIVSGVEKTGESDFRETLTEETLPQPEFFFEKPIDIDSFLEAIKGLIGPRVLRRSK